MEKQDKINKLKNDTIDEEFSSLYPKELELIKQLTNKDKLLLNSSSIVSFTV